ncbi:hypothetical protein CH371_19830 [Leptospira wolffii]|uniref:Uncharacterized protein n=1 Tax=Leptospira wolffii TaxID=409998 RepID=A0A2M9Z6R4_9LEPT|nr:hypothetical protein CH371_19830 [Leptospira wolffii]
MIRPHKHLDLESNVLTVSKKILDRLISNQVLTLGEIMQEVKIDNRLVFQSLSFLFLLGLVSYEEEIDSIVLANEIK